MKYMCFIKRNKQSADIKVLGFVCTEAGHRTFLHAIIINKYYLESSPFGLSFWRLRYIHAGR